MAKNKMNQKQSSLFSELNLKLNFRQKADREQLFYWIDELQFITGAAPQILCGVAPFVTKVTSMPCEGTDDGGCLMSWSYSGAEHHARQANQSSGSIKMLNYYFVMLINFEIGFLVFKNDIKLFAFLVDLFIHFKMLVPNILYIQEFYRIGNKLPYISLCSISTEEKGFNTSNCYIFQEHHLIFRFACSFVKHCVQLSTKEQQNQQSKRSSE